jgi:hypothetical protein
MVDLITETSLKLGIPPFEIFRRAYFNIDRDTTAETNYCHREWIVDEVIDEKTKLWCLEKLAEHKKTSDVKRKPKPS